MMKWKDVVKVKKKVIVLKVQKDGHDNNINSNPETEMIFWNCLCLTKAAQAFFLVFGFLKNRNEFSLTLNFLFLIGNIE